MRNTRICAVAAPAIWVAGSFLLFSSPSFAQDVPKILFPYGQKPISYFGKQADDPIALLEKKLIAGETHLKFEPKYGYLRSLLQTLDVPLESQVLVFSKTALNHKLVSPRTPRAIYFNDEVYVAWIPKLTALEISSVDPFKGGMFYTLPQNEDQPPRFGRGGNCLTCHSTSSSLEVPGHLLRSFSTDDDGNPLSGLRRIDHRTPFPKRWGGWYVSGRHGKLVHLGNVVGTDAHRKHRKDPSTEGNVTDLKLYFDVAQYLTPHSDLIALMVLDHQVHLQNLLTRFGYEHRFKRKETVEDDLLKYLFFIDEPALPDEITGTSGFAQAFEFQGPEDFNGRSLRQFNLKTRLFKYRLSYLIYSRAFRKLPASARERIDRRIYDVLIGKDDSPAFRNFPKSERQAILEILRETLDDLPAYYKTGRAK